MKNLLILSLFITIQLALLDAQEVRVVAPADSLKSSSDTTIVSVDTTLVSVDTTKLPVKPEVVANNFIKFNITSALAKNFSFQYERVMSKRVSLGLIFRFMPESHIPYIDKIIKWADITDLETQNVVKSLYISNYTIAPEIRLYTGKKGYGRGFYFDFFYQYGHYEVNNALIPYDTDNGDHVTITSSGSVSSHTGGFMIGAQWALGKHICLDWWIMGPHFGVSSGDGLGLSSGPLSEVDQQNIEDEINKVDIPMFKPTVDATADKVTLKFDGPWGGIKAGLSIGVRF